MLKKNGGITLIALVVTIIVLLILAGITIAMLTGPNGIISRTNDSKVKQIEGQVQEEVKLAVQSAKIYAMQKSVETSTGWFASKNMTEVKGVMDKDDLKSPTYTFTSVTDATTDTPIAKFVITYATSDYRAATNNNQAKIVAEVSVKNNNFKLTKLDAYRVGTTPTNLITDTIE